MPKVNPVKKSDDTHWKPPAGENFTKTKILNKNIKNRQMTENLVERLKFILEEWNKRLNETIFVAVLSLIFFVFLFPAVFFVHWSFVFLCAMSGAFIFFSFKEGFKIVEKVSRLEFEIYHLEDLLNRSRAFDCPENFEREFDKLRNKLGW